MPQNTISHVSTEYGDIILNESTGDYWHLNHTAAAIFELLHSGSTRDEVIEKLVDRYDAPRERAREDVSTLEAQLKEAGAV